MARNTRRRAAQQRNRKVLDILNGVAEGQEDGDGAHATTIEQHIDAESVDHDHGDGQRQTRRSVRLNKRTTRDVTPAPINIPEPPDSPMFFSDHEPESEPEDAADEEADEADEGEDERGVEEDGDSVESEEDTSMSDHEQQLWQEQEQAIANSQQEQLKLGQALLSSPPSVVIDRKKERLMDEDATTTRAAETETSRANTNHNDLFGGDDEFADSESEQGDENDEESASDNSFDMNNSRHDVGAALQDLFAWDDHRSVQSDEPDEVAEPTEAVQRTRIDDRLETQTPRTNGSSSRKRRRASNDSTDMPDRTRRRRESPNQNIERAPSCRPPVVRGPPEVADWEAAMPEERTQDQVIVVGESTTYDDATKVQGLQGTWKRLLEYCQKVKKKEVTRTWRYTRVEEIVDRITDLLKDYKRMQRTRSRGRPIDPDTWKRTRQEVKYISEDADKIREVIIRRAKEGKASNDLQAQADAVEYAHVIVQQVMTSLCELALECLKTYYSEEDECLLNGGFGAVLDIIDIVGELDTILKSLHNCAMVVLSPYPGLPIRQELGSIRRSFKNAEANELRRGR